MLGNATGWKQVPPHHPPHHPPIMGSDGSDGSDSDLSSSEEESLPTKRNRTNCNRNLVNFDLADPSNEASILRKELGVVHSTYLTELKKRDDEMAQLKYDNDRNDERLTCMELKLFRLAKYHADVIEDKNEWIGMTLKFEYLFKSMKKIGLSQSSDIFECFEDIDVPDVSIDLKDLFVPTVQTDNIDWHGIDDDDDDDDDDDIIGYQ